MCVYVCETETVRVEFGKDCVCQGILEEMGGKIQ